MKIPDPIMTVDQVAAYLKLHPLTIRRLAREGEIPAFKVGRQWRVKRELLELWMEERSSKNVDAAPE
jgi:excisionase family DNA binding protein